MDQEIEIEELRYVPPSLPIPDGWKTNWALSRNGWRCVSRIVKVGGAPSGGTPFNPFNIQPASSGDLPKADEISPILKLDKGDYCQLKVSKRKFRILDERKDDQSNFEELCKFDDDNRNPIWLPHSWLVGEVNILEKT